MKEKLQKFMEYLEMKKPVKKKSSNKGSMLESSKSYRMEDQMAMVDREVENMPE